jgi:hypothetical protein
MTQFEVLSQHLPQGMEENLSQDSWNPSTGLNQAPPEHKY